MLGVRFTVAVLIFSAAAFGQTTVTYIYVGENTSPQKIAAFSIKSDGSVHTVSGSPFTAPSQSLTASTNYLYATDHQKIAAYKRNSSGTLTLLSSFNGVRNGDAEVGTLTLDRSAASLYASEDNGLGDNDYDIYDKLSSGNLSYVTSTKFNISYGGPLRFSTANKFAYESACLQAEFVVNGFIRDADGVLTPFSPNAPLPPTSTPEDLCPTDLATSAQGYVAVPYGDVTFTGTQNIAIYRIHGDGTLSYVSKIATNFAMTSTFNLSLQFDSTGTFLAVAGQKGIQLYRLSSTGILSKVGSPLYTGTTFRSLKWDKTNHIYTISGSAVYFFKLNNGKLSQSASPRSVPKASSLITVSLQ